MTTASGTPEEERMKIMVEDQVNWLAEKCAEREKRFGALFWKFCDPTGTTSDEKNLVLFLMEKAVEQELSQALQRAERNERDGWVSVPREPTEAMLKAAEREWDGRMSVRSTGVWKAMLDAARSAGG